MNAPESIKVYDAQYFHAQYSDDNSTLLLIAEREYDLPEQPDEYIAVYEMGDIDVWRLQDEELTIYTPIVHTLGGPTDVRLYLLPEFTQWNTMITQWEEYRGTVRLWIENAAKGGRATHIATLDRRDNTTTSHLEDISDDYAQQLIELHLQGEKRISFIERCPIDGLLLREGRRNTYTNT